MGRIQCSELGSLQEAWDVYREIHWPRLARKTRQEYSACMSRALKELPDALTPAEIVVWQSTLLERYSYPYANQILQCVRTVARRSAMVTGDTDLQAVVWSVNPVREPVRSPKCPPADLMTRCLEIAADNGELCWLYLAGLAGLRRGELLGLRPSDYDRELRVLRVVRQRKSAHRKNRRPHSVVLDDPEVCRLLEWCICHPQEMRSRSGWHKGLSEGYVFPWNLRRLDGFLGRLKAALGPNYFPPRSGWHVFRHWGATELARDGAAVFDVQAWLGDTDPKMASTYVAMVRGMTSSSVSRLAARMDRAAVKPNHQGCMSTPGDSYPSCGGSWSTRDSESGEAMDRKLSYESKPPTASPSRKRAKHVDGTIGDPKGTWEHE